MDFELADDTMLDEILEKSVISSAQSEPMRPAVDVLDLLSNADPLHDMLATNSGGQGKLKF